MTLPCDIARCDGAGWDECDDCQRRTAPRPDQACYMTPPPIVTFVCEYYIEPDHPQRRAA